MQFLKIIKNTNILVLILLVISCTEDATIITDEDITNTQPDIVDTQPEPPNFYVSSNGNDLKTGTSLENSWKRISRAKASMINNGNIVYSSDIASPIRGVIDFEGKHFGMSEAKPGVISGTRSFKQNTIYEQEPLADWMSDGDLSPFYYVGDRNNINTLHTDSLPGLKYSFKLKSVNGKGFLRRRIDLTGSWRLTLIYKSSDGLSTPNLQIIDIGRSVHWLDSNGKWATQPETITLPHRSNFDEVDTTDFIQPIASNKRPYYVDISVNQGDEVTLNGFIIEQKVTWEFYTNGIYRFPYSGSGFDKPKAIWRTNTTSSLQTPSLLVEGSDIMSLDPGEWVYDNNYIYYHLRSDETLANLNIEGQYQRFCIDAAYGNYNLKNLTLYGCFSGLHSHGKAIVTGSNLDIKYNVTPGLLLEGNSVVTIEKVNSSHHFGNESIHGEGMLIRDNARVVISQYKGYSNSDDCINVRDNIDVTVFSFECVENTGNGIEVFGSSDNNFPFTGSAKFYNGLILSNKKGLITESSNYGDMSQVSYRSYKNILTIQNSPDKGTVSLNTLPDSGVISASNNFLTGSGERATVAPDIYKNLAGYGNPILTDEIANNFHPLAGSPLINSGAIWWNIGSPLPLDMDGKPYREYYPVIGPYEY